MKISVKLGVSQESRHETFTMDDLGFTEVEWKTLSGEEKKLAINNAVNDMSEQPYWVMEDFDENE